MRNGGVQDPECEVGGATPDLPTIADDGTDLTVIRWMLAMSPEERLRWLQSHMQAVATLRRDQPDA